MSWLDRWKDGWMIYSSVILPYLGFITLKMKINKFASRIKNTKHKIDIAIKQRNIMNMQAVIL